VYHDVPSCVTFISPGYGHWEGKSIEKSSNAPQILVCCAGFIFHLLQAAWVYTTL